MAKKNDLSSIGAHDKPNADLGKENLLGEERRMQILHRIRTEGRVIVNELASAFNTSAVTIRNDLKDLHQRGLVLRSHGGAVSPDRILRESPVNDRARSHADEKRRIGAMAASLISNGETIVIDSGTTTMEIARGVTNQQALQVITNGVNIAAELLEARNVQTFIIGGAVRSESASIVGRTAEDMLHQFAADKFFLSGAGCDPDFGVSGANLDEAIVTKAMIRIAREIILVADSSKFSKRALARIAEFSEIDTVISDTNLGNPLQKKIKGFGCNLILV
jgi:DeoR family transcriptional regulator of aga operon